MWNFGSMKTFSQQLAMYEMSKNKVFVISNVPYIRNDWFYSSVDDLVKVFAVLDEWCQKTNYDIQEYALNRSRNKDIYFIVDEAHRYFDSRSSLFKWNNMEVANNVLTQCRKRNIRFVAITQRLTSIDIRIRRLADYVEEYKRWNFLWLYRVRHNVYENRGDLADIETDNTVRIASDWSVNTLKDESKLYGEFFSPWTMFLQFGMLFSKAYREIAKEYYNTYYICGLNDRNVDYFNCELLEKALYTPKYLRSDATVINGETSNKAPNKLILLNKTYHKVRDKIIKVLDTRSVGDSVKNNVYPTQNSIQNTLKELKSDEIQNEIIQETKKEVIQELENEKKSSVLDLL